MLPFHCAVRLRCFDELGIVQGYMYKDPLGSSIWSPLRVKVCHTRSGPTKFLPVLSYKPGMDPRLNTTLFWGLSWRVSWFRASNFIKTQNFLKLTIVYFHSLLVLYNLHCIFIYLKHLVHKNYLNRTTNTRVIAPVVRCALLNVSTLRRADILTCDPLRS